MSTYDKRSPADAYSDPENDHYPYLQLKTSSHLIIPQWSTGSIYGLVAAMLAAIFAGVGYEFLNEYSRHLHNRYTRKDGSRCCGVDVFGCCEKFFMSILVVIRVVIGYFMMLCVMTMNIWLLVSVILGAGIGYAIGKPVIANMFTDSVSSYEYPVVRVKPSDDDDDDEFGGNITARSQSWRYRPTSKRLMESTGKRLMESAVAHDDVTQRQKDTLTRYTLRPNSSNQDAINVVLVRESKHGTTVPHVTDIKDEDDIVFLRAKADNMPETRTAYSQTLPASHNRFKSTSLVINQSFRSTSSYSPRQSRVKSGTSSSRSPKGSGRFKPISKVIIDQQTSDHV